MVTCDGVSPALTAMTLYTSPFGGLPRTFPSGLRQPPARSSRITSGTLNRMRELRDGPNARRSGRRALLLNEFFGGDRRMSVTEVSNADGPFRRTSKILDRQGLMPGPDLRAHESVCRLRNC